MEYIFIRCILLWNSILRTTKLMYMSLVRHKKYRIRNTFMCVWGRVCVCVYACMRACACVRACVRACVIKLIQCSMRNIYICFAVQEDFMLKMFTGDIPHHRILDANLNIYLLISRTRHFESLVTNQLYVIVDSYKRGSIYILYVNKRNIYAPLIK